MDAIEISRWGKDHWSLFAYLGTRVVDYQGTTNPQHMRGKFNNMWKPEYGSRLKGYFENRDPEYLLDDHDDYDCLHDIEAAGFIKNNGSGINPLVSFTDEGYDVLLKLTKHKASGGNFAEFEYKE